jgi:AraC-like DNA-binding protein
MTLSGLVPSDAVIRPRATRIAARAAAGETAAVEQRAIVGGRRSIRRYWLVFDADAAAGDESAAGRLVRSSRITESWGMRPRLEQDSRWRRILSCYSLVYLFRGQGVYFQGPDDPGRPLVAGDVICLFPGIPHAYAPEPGHRWDEINIDFVGPVFDAWQMPGLLDPAEPIRHLEPIAYWQHQLEDLAAEAASSPGGQGIRGVGRLLELIGRMATDWRPDADKKTSRWIEAAKDRIDTVPAGVAIDCRAIASDFGIGEQMFRKRFRRVTGLTPRQYRSRRIIERACLLLEQTNQTSRSIAAELGFETEFYFSRRFKQLMGVSPREYRQRAGHGGQHSVVEDLPRPRSGPVSGRHRRRKA